MGPPRPGFALVSQSPGADYGIFRTRRLVVADLRTGLPADRTVIDAPDWVNVIALTAEDELILIRQFRFGVWEDTLEIPGGMVDEGEDAQGAAARELEEETGYVAGEVSLIGTSQPNPAIQGNRLHTFLATGCRRVHAGRQDSSEDIDVELHPREAVPQLVRSGQIAHALVLAALYYQQVR